MKTPAVLIWFLASLLLCGLTGLEAYRKGKESFGREQMMDIIEDNRAAMQEVRHAYTDFSRVMNVIRILDQQRITEGEQRREEMQKAAQGDTCASAYPPAAVTGRLQQHAAHVENQTRLRAGTDSSDKADHGSGTGNTRDMVQSE
ncbi:TPA: hypothetical protein ACWXMK_002487 [Escherichia coli]